MNRRKAYWTRHSIADFPNDIRELRVYPSKPGSNPSHLNRHVFLRCHLFFSFFFEKKPISPFFSARNIDQAESLSKHRSSAHMNRIGAPHFLQGTRSQIFGLASGTLSPLSRLTIRCTLVDINLRSVMACRASCPIRSADTSNSPVGTSTTPPHPCAATPDCRHPEARRNHSPGGGAGRF
jgi:hypothetical protein